MAKIELATPILGITGRAGAGKDTVSDFICELVKLRSKHFHQATKIACADPLKEMCFDVFSTAFDVPREAFYGSQAQKEALLESVPGWSGRRILQYVGTEGFRHVHEDVWSKLMIGRARKLLDHPSNHTKLVVVSDIRFLSEANAIQNAGGLIVRVKRPEADLQTSSHKSETELSEIKEDYVIDNKGRELYLLRDLVEEFLSTLGF
jgi:hypothetical protein